MPGHPELVAVALPPVGAGLARVADLLRRCLGHPLLGDELGSLPAAPLQVQQPELGDVLGAGVQATEALFAPGREGLPADMPDTERVEQPGPQVLGERHPRITLNDAGQRVRAGLAVGEDRAGLAVGRDQQEPADRLSRVTHDRLAQHVPGMTGGHRGDVPDFHRPAARVGDVPGELGEVRDNRVVQVEQALGLRERRRGGGEALAERVQQLRPPGAVRPPPSLSYHPPVPHQHQAVHLDARTLIHRVQEAEDRGRIDPLIRWRTSRQGTRHDASLGHHKAAGPVTTRPPSAPHGRGRSRPAAGSGCSAPPPSRPGQHGARAGAAVAATVTARTWVKKPAGRLDCRNDLVSPTS